MGRLRVLDYTGLQELTPEQQQRLRQLQLAEQNARLLQQQQPQQQHRHAAAAAEYRFLHNQPVARLNSGHDIPLIGLGTWKSSPGQVRAAVLAAVRCGYRHIDCASVYGNEHEVGAALAELFAEGVVRREQLFITGKLWNSHHGAADVPKAVAKTLQDLGLTYLDLYLIHWPVVTGCVGPEVRPSIAETWAAMQALVQAGLVRSIGLSNFSAAKLNQLLQQPGLAIKPAVLQVEAHPYWPNSSLISAARAAGLHVTAYSPLGSPDSATIMRRGNDSRRLLEDPTVAAVAARLEKSTAQVLIRWALQRGTSCLPKSANAGRIASNFDVFDWQLEPADMAEISNLDHRQRMVSGVMWLHPKGPYKTMKDLWDEAEDDQA